MLITKYYPNLNFFQIIRRYAYKIARCWLKVARKVRTDQRLTLFYLINDVVQVSHFIKSNWRSMNHV